MDEPAHAGDPCHRDHEQWLLALGRATFAAQAMAGVAIDVLRVHCGVDFWDLVKQPFGGLITTMRGHDHPPGMARWLDELDAAGRVRNDLMHATPVLHGLHRRDAKDRGRVVNFFDVADLESATSVLVAATRSGNVLLYFDGGSAVQRYSAGEDAPGTRS